MENIKSNFLLSVMVSIEDKGTYHRFMIMEYFSTNNLAIYAHHLLHKISLITAL